MIDHMRPYEAHCGQEIMNDLVRLAKKHGFRKKRGTTKNKSRHWFNSSDDKMINPFKWTKLHNLSPLLQPISY